MLGGDITTDEVTPTFSVDRQNARVAIGTDASSVPDPYTMYVSGEMYATRLHGDGSQLTGLTDSAWGPAGDDISYVDGDVSIGITESNGKRLRVHESGNDVLVVDGANLRVGVATGSPNANLHVEGNVYVSSNLEVSNINFTGSFNQNGTPFESSPWTTTGDDLSYTTGNVGIGTPSPDANLHVEGNIYVSSNLEVDGATISTITEPPTPAWATSIGGTSSDYGQAIATDSGGNVYVTGQYQGTATFGSGVSLTSTGSYDVFVAKYNTSGTAQWATSIGGGTFSIDAGYGIATDSGGNVYVTGQYQYIANFGSGVSLTSAGSSDVFVAKYDTSGTAQWATSIGGTSSDYGQGIATDSGGNVYVTGQYSGTVTFASGTTLTSAGSSDAFVAKYNTNGTAQWATSIGGTSSDYGYGIATDGAGNVYVTGNYQGTATFAPGTTLTSAGSSDAFVAKYNTSGTAQWATSIGGTSSDYGYGIATDSAGNVYVTGRYVLTADFGSGVSITSAGSYDAFFAKYNTSGIVQWATSIGGTFSIDAGYGIATDSAGNVYVTGYHDGTVTIGSTTLTSAGNYDAFVAKYSSLKNLRIYTGLEVGTANLFVDTVNSRVGIGTTTPGYTLDVQGDLNVSGTTTNVSDKRLKSNVHVIENALEKVGKLSGYTFTMNNKQNAGVIAQEVLEVLPEVVGGSEETTYSVAYGNMASLFIEAIKELERKVETLENRI